MIEFQSVSKSFGGQDVLVEASFQVNPGQRVGVVGPNGAGKSTVFELIVGEVSADKGSVSIPQSSRLGYVRQQVSPDLAALTLLEYAESVPPALAALQEEIFKLEQQFKDGIVADRDQALERLGALQSSFEAEGGYSTRHRAESALSGLGFSDDTFLEPFAALSGGWQLRAELARVLALSPDILLLDEPSNYLDIPAVEWLQRHLRDFRGTLLLISHDRYLLNSLTTVTIEIANTRAERYPGNYDWYSQERAQRHEQRVAARKNLDRRRAQAERFIERFRSKNTKASQVQSRIKMLERMEDITIPKAIVSPGRIRLKPPPHSGAEILRLENVGQSYDGSRWVLRNIDLRIERKEKTAVVGLNGLGKTTLLRIMAGVLPPSEGRRVPGHKVIIGYQSQNFTETISPELTVFHAVKSAAPDVSEQETRTILGGFGFSGDTIDKPVSVLSGGEKVRVAFARLLIRPPNVLILDEPTTHLDIQAREALERALADYTGTILMVSHDIDFIRHVATTIIAMQPPGIARYHGNYDYYREKIAGETGTAAEPRARQQTAGPPADAQAGKQSSKELRKQRAQSRQELHLKTKELKKRIRRVEQKIAGYEKERGRIVEQLSQPGSQTDFEELNKRLAFLDKQIQMCTWEWERDGIELEEIQGGH